MRKCYFAAYCDRIDGCNERSEEKAVERAQAECSKRATPIKSDEGAADECNIENCADD